MERHDTSFTPLRLTRRLLLGAGLGTAAAAALAGAATVLRAAEAVVRAAAPSARPVAVGTSTSRCARCGATDHTMLTGCPLDPLPRAPGLQGAGRPGSPGA